MSKYQLMAIAKRIVSKQLKSFSYLSMVLIPVVVGEAIVYKSQDFLQTLTVKQLSLGLYQLMPGLAAFLCAVYTGILATEVVADREAKLTEFLLAIVDAKTQLVGKILGTVVLLVLHCLSYFLLLLATVVIFKLRLAMVDVKYLVFSLLSLLLLLGSSLIWTVEFGIYIQEREQMALAMLTPVILVMTGEASSMLYAYTPNMFAGMVWFKVFLVVNGWVPALGTCLLPVAVSTQGLSYFWGYFSLVVQVIILVIMFKKVLPKYQRGLLATKQRHPIIKAIFGK
ncbi:hypothetical protein AB3Q54_10450 [Ligilactobacillus agilis]|uniref:Uncharacterized protein n=1 Tax=Ligilactobacillus agilis TaxID=1601 RepID=A0A6F9Y6F2_9LACO|nr:hypothetical protein [Ligilactobacillus agilis]GET12900.1 hypothetical protein SN811_14000 [Ligilactobacillus agilis]